MCDYSLEHLASRPAKVGDKLVSTKFTNSITRGFTAIGEPNVAVCLMPGTELAFEQEVGNDPRHRHHVRFWKVLDQGQEKRPVWLGAVTFDRSVGVSHFTGAITHHIGPDVDAERQLLATDLEAAGMVTAKYQVTGVGPTVTGRNGGGDPYYTDGEVWILRLTAGCLKQTGPVTVIPSPPATELKDQIWHGIADALHKQPPTP